MSSFLAFPVLSDKPRKTGKARVLTSEKCLKILKEKERKREEAENREKRRQENLEKKRLRDEERKRKSEELARKRAEREAAKAVKEAEKAANKADKEAQKAAKEAEKISKQVPQATLKQTRCTTRKSEGECINTNRNQNRLDIIVIQICVVSALGATMRMRELTGKDRSASAFGGFRRIALIMKTQVLIVVSVPYAKTVLHISVYVDMRIRCNCLGKGSCL